MLTGMPSARRGTTASKDKIGTVWCQVGFYLCGKSFFLPFLAAWDSVRLRTNVPGRYGPYGELFFFLLKKEPMVLRELVRNIPVELLKACALIGLHIMIQENSGRSENGCCVSSSSSDENNVGNDALFVIGSHGSGDTIALFLQDCVVQLALSCHMALDMMCQESSEVERRRGWFGF